MPVYNNNDTIYKSINSIYNQDCKDHIRLIVVNDGSKDDSQNEIEKSRVQFDKDGLEIVVITKENGGEASSLNRGLSYIFEKNNNSDLPDYVGIVEADVFLESNWLSLLISEIKNDEKIYASGGFLLPQDGLNPVARVTGYDVEYRMLIEGKIVPHLTSANVLYKRRAFEEFGRFNEELKNAALDNDFNFRIISNGKKLIRSFEAIAYHKYKASVLAFLQRQYYYARYRPFLKYSLSYRGDNLIKAGVFISLCFILSLFVIPWIFYLPVILLLLNISINIIPLPKISKRHRDKYLFIYPFLMSARAFAGLLGYGVGYLKKLFNITETKTQGD